MMSCWECSGSTRQSSTARSRWLGQELRGKRLNTGIAIGTAAQELDWLVEKLTGAELGEFPLGDLEVAEFLTLCEAPTAETRRLIDFNREADDDTWLQPFDQDPSLRIRTPLFEETRATRIIGYHPMLVPGPLRTSAYAQVLDGLDQLAERNENLERVDATFYLDEHVLKRVVGDLAVMREQIAQLLDSPATILMVPPRAPVACEAFTIMDNAQEKAVVHLQIKVANLFLENPEQVEIYRAVTADLNSAAWDTNTSRNLLLNWIDEHTR